MTASEKKEGELLVPRERRDYPRISVKVHVNYNVIDGEEAEYAMTKKFDPEKILEQATGADAVNVSTSGLLMYSEEDIPLQTFVAVNMYLPLPGLSCACKCLAEVVRSEKDDTESRWLIGLKFLKVLHHNLNKYKFMTLTDLLDIAGEQIKLD